MRFVFTALALLASTGASAGQIKVSVSTPVVITVDGQLLNYGAGSMSATAYRLGGGTHEVKVANLFGKVITKMTVDLKPTEEVRVNYSRKTLSIVGRGEAADAAPPVQQTDPASVVEGAANAAVSAMADAVDSLDSLDLSPVSAPPAAAAPPPPTAAPAPASSGPSSLEVSGVSALDGAVWIDGRAVKYANGTRAYVQPNVTPGAHIVRIEMSSRPKFDGELEFAPGMNTRCVMVYQNMGYEADCHQTTPAHGNVNQTIATFGPPPKSGSTAAPAAPARPAAVAMDAASFESLRSAVANESFSSDQISMIQTAASRNHFTCAQLGKLMDEGSQGSTKVAFAKAIVPNVVDPGNAHLLSAHLSFSSDKDAVQALFK